MFYYFNFVINIIVFNKYYNKFFCFIKVIVLLKSFKYFKYFLVFC